VAAGAVSAADLRADKYQQFLSQSRAERSPALRRVVPELLQTEWLELARLANQDKISPEVAARSFRDPRVEEAEVT
jgi:hypothetical protein